MSVAFSSIISVKAAHNLDFQHKWSALVQAHACSQTRLWLTGLAHAIMGSTSCSVDSKADCISHQHGELTSFFRVAGAVTAFIYLTNSCARYSAACGNQKMDGIVFFQTFTQGPVLVVSGFRMGCAFNCCFSGCQEGLKR